MKLYEIMPTAPFPSVDYYVSAIVAARNEEEAKKIHPSGLAEWRDSGTWDKTPDTVVARLIGTAIRGTKSGVILSSFYGV